MRLCLVEDLAVAGLEPLTLTRPVHELWLGCSSLGSKIAQAFGVGPGPQRRGSVIRSHLVAVQRQRDPHVVVNDRLEDATEQLLEIVSSALRSR